MSTIKWLKSLLRINISTKNDVRMSSSNGWDEDFKSWCTVTYSNQTLHNIFPFIYVKVLVPKFYYWFLSYIDIYMK